MQEDRFILDTGRYILDNIAQARADGFEVAVVIMLKREGADMLQKMFLNWMCCGIRLQVFHLVGLLKDMAVRLEKEARKNGA